MAQRSSRMVQLVVGCLLVFGLGVAPAAAGGRYDDRYDEPSDRAYRYEHRTETSARADDPYVFSTTRMINDWDAPAAIKVPLLPAAFVVDVVFLPAEVIADAVR
jgi:hypothetical protein